MDLIDEILSDWEREKPDIDWSGKAVACRILHTYSAIIAAQESTLKPLGINPTIFSVLVTIRRKGPDAEVTVSKIMQEALVTSGAMSNLINKLANLGYVTKRKASSNEDLRASFIKLTPKGLKTIDKAMIIQAACERRSVQNLNSAEKKQLSNLLKKMSEKGD